MTVQFALPPLAIGQSWTLVIEARPAPDEPELKAVLIESHSRLTLNRIEIGSQMAGAILIRSLHKGGRVTAHGPDRVLHEQWLSEAL
jgi:hypothetical protein